MFNFDVPLSTADLAALGGVLFVMFTGRMLHEETRVASYALIAAVLSSNPAVLYVVPILAFVVKMVRLP
jgi:hypothetical protein